MGRRGKNTQALNSWAPPAFAATVERVAALEGDSKSGLTRRALLTYLMPPKGDDR